MRVEEGAEQELTMRLSDWASACRAEAGPERRSRRGA